jgi:anaerobic magnesium-protoporphyrin IX monomethyl ester cyclase
LRVTLINPQYAKGYIHSARWDSITISGSHWYPIFLAYCTGLLEKHGHECKLVDAEAENLNDENVLRISKKFKPDFSVIYISERGLKGNLRLARNIKRKTKSKIIFVGPWASTIPKQTLKSKTVDHVVDGEFEFAVKDIVEGRLRKKYIKSKRLTSKQLNELPWVTEVYAKHLKIRNYKIGSLWHPFVDLFTGRKCYWGKCTFCLWPNTIFEKGGYISRDINDVLDEIKWAVENIKPRIKEIFIQDDTPTALRCKELAEGLIKRGIKIQWSTYARGDLTLTPKILRLMKKSGCHCLHVGYESGNDEILKNINKGLTVKDLETFTRWATNAGIDIHGDFMIGLPGETRETIRNTINWAKKLNIVTYQFAPPKPYKCTPYYNWLVKNNYIDDNGNPNLPNMSYKEMIKWSKRALRECYFNLGFIKRIMFKPHEINRLLRSAFNLSYYILFRRSDLPEGVWTK